MAGDSFSMNAWKPDLLSRRDLATSPGVSEMATWKTVFARSTAMTVVLFSMGSSLEHRLRRDPDSLRVTRPRPGEESIPSLERTRRGGVPRLRGAFVRVSPRRSTQCSTGSRWRRVRRLVIVFVLFGAPGVCDAIEIKLGLGGCLPGAMCGWSVEIAADRSAKLEVRPEGHLSKRFMVSRKPFAEIVRAVEQERFFSLPSEVGDYPVDGPGAWLEITDGKTHHVVELGVLPKELRAIWKTDSGSTSRAFRLCEAVRSLVPAQVSRCWGVPAEGEK
jgi:hypothetical protein